MKKALSKGMSGMSGDSKSRMPGALRPAAERASSTGNTLWDDVRELLDVWDQKNTAMREDVRMRLQRLKSEGESHAEAESDW